MGDTTLVETHEKLKKIQSELSKLENQLETKSGTLENLERKKSRLDDDLQVYEKRKALEEKKVNVQNSIKWEKFKTLRKQVKETRDRERSLKKNIDSIEEKQKPIRIFLQSYEDKVREMKRRMDAADKDHFDCNSKAEEFDIAEKEDAIERLTEAERDLVQQEEDRISSKEKLNQEIRELEHFIATNKPDPQLETNIAQLTSRRSTQDSSFQRNDQNLNRIQFDLENSRRDRARILRAFDDLQDERNRKLRKQ